jgi:DNA-binding beta-propeller fold protein YncE
VQSVITSSLGGLWGVAWDNDHTLLVTQFFGVAQVLRVDPVTGHVTIAVSDARFAQPRGILVQPNGDIFMADYLAFGSGAIFKISGGTTTVFSSGGIMNGPHGIRFDPNGNILVANYFGGNVIKIDGTNGEQSLVSPQSGANLFWTPHDVEVVPGGYRVAIDIKPGGSPNSINLKSEGVVPVAILGSQSFNVVDVDVSTVSFAGALPEKFAYEDVNSDGLIDLVFHFRTQHLQLTSSSTEAILIGKLRDGRSITGTDSVRIVPSGPKS